MIILSNQRAAPQRLPQNPDNTQVPIATRLCCTRFNSKSASTTCTRAASIVSYFTCYCIIVFSVNRTYPEMLYCIVADYIESEFPQEMHGITKTTVKYLWCNVSNFLALGSRFLSFYTKQIRAIKEPWLLNFTKSATGDKDAEMESCRHCLKDTSKKYILYKFFPVQPEDTV